MLVRLASVGLTGLVAFAACTRGPMGAGSATTTAAGLGSPSRRTVDSAGFVDNAGRTEDERKTMISSRRGAGGRERAAAAGSYESAAVGVPGYVVVARFARARCDRELTCGNIGPGKRHGSDDACVQNVRPVAYADIDEAGCAAGFEQAGLGACLNTIRHVGCEQDLADLDVLENCQSAAVCAGE